MEPFTAVYSNGDIIVPTQSEADALLQDGYGYRKNRTHFLRGVETLYNVERGKIFVVEESTNNTLSFQELLQRLSKNTPDLWINFIVYKDLRQRGFIIDIKEGFKVYERGDYGSKPPSYEVKIVSEGKPELIDEFVNDLMSVEENGLSMKVAVVDRRGEIVYYGVEEKTL